MATHRTTQAHVRMVAEFVASRAEPTARSEVISKLGLHEAPSTVYRWLSDACSQGLITREGDRKSSAYIGSPGLRAEIMRRTIRADISTRPRVGYNREFLASYDCDRAPYLKPAELEQLMCRCPPGTMPMSGFTDHEISMFMNDLSFASSRLDGNQYDLAGTIALLEHDIPNSSLPLRDKVQLLNHRDACRYLIRGVREDADSFTLSSYMIRGVHALLSADLLKDRSMCGTLRNGQVSIKGSSYIPLSMAAQIEPEFLSLVNIVQRISNPFEQAFFLLVHIPYLQPFVDCNKRTARVICNLPLLKGGITPLSWMDTDQRAYTEALLAIYEHNDTALMSEVFVASFMRAAERFSDMQRQREPDPISAKYRPQIRETIRARVLDNVERISSTVRPDDVPDFLAYIDMELNELTHNSMLGVRYNLTPVAVETWVAARSAASHESPDQRERQHG